MITHKVCVRSAVVVDDFEEPTNHYNDEVAKCEDGAFHTVNGLANTEAAVSPDSLYATGISEMLHGVLRPALSLYGVSLEFTLSGELAESRSILQTFGDSMMTASLGSLKREQTLGVLDIERSAVTDQHFSDVRITKGCRSVEWGP
nr:hypothetical protein CFP56_74962 [Quercus suber]